MAPFQSKSVESNVNGALLIIVIHRRSVCFFVVSKVSSNNTYNIKQVHLASGLSTMRNTTIFNSLHLFDFSLNVWLSLSSRNEWTIRSTINLAKHRFIALVFTAAKYTCHLLIFSLVDDIRFITQNRNVRLLIKQCFKNCFKKKSTYDSQSQ